MVDHVPRVNQVAAAGAVVGVDAVVVTPTPPGKGSNSRDNNSKDNNSKASNARSNSNNNRASSNVQG